jgi:hypothetical protein
MMAISSVLALMAALSAAASYAGSPILQADLKIDGVVFNVEVRDGGLLDVQVKQGKRQGLFLISDSKDHSWQLTLLDLSAFPHKETEAYSFVEGATISLSSGTIVFSTHPKQGQDRRREAHPLPLDRLHEKFDGASKGRCCVRCRSIDVCGLRVRGTCGSCQDNPN